MYDEAYQEQATMRLCLPIKQPLTVTDQQLELWHLRPETALSLIHYGDYAYLSDTYKRLLDDAKRRGYSLLTPSRLVYLKGPGKILRGNPAAYETQIIMPFKKA